MDTYTDKKLNAFFTKEVENLPDNYYSAQNRVCDICSMDEKAEVPEVSGEGSTISPTAVVQTRSCKLPHTFHKLCLHTWLHLKLRKDKDASCPMCRQKLIMSPTSMKLERFLTGRLAQAEAIDQQWQSLMARKVETLRLMLTVEGSHETTHALLENLRVSWERLQAEIEDLRQMKARCDMEIEFCRNAIASRA